MAEMRLRSETIRAKIKDLTPDLYQVSETDFNLVDKKVSRAEARATAT